MQLVLLKIKILTAFPWDWNISCMLDLLIIVLPTQLQCSWNHPHSIRYCSVMIHFYHNIHVQILNSKEIIQSHNLQYQQYFLFFNMIGVNIFTYYLNTTNSLSGTHFMSFTWSSLQSFQKFSPHTLNQPHKYYPCCNF